MHVIRRDQLVRQRDPCPGDGCLERVIGGTHPQAARRRVGAFKSREREPVDPDRRRVHRGCEIVVDQRKAREIGRAAQSLLDKSR